MKLSAFKEVVTRLVELEQRRNEYAAKLPTEVHMFLVDNEYANVGGLQFDLVFQTLFGRVLCEDVYWLLLNWSPNRGDQLWLDGEQMTIDTIDDFFSYVEKAYGLVD